MDQCDYLFSSPFGPWLGTNRGLSDYGPSRLQGFLQEPVQELTALDNKIEVLVARRDRLKRGIEEHMALMHPIRNFPNELLQEIFWHTLPTKHFPAICVKDAPISLTQVCQKWRKVAFSTAELWSCLHIVPIPTSTTTPNSRLVMLYTERVRRWLNAAGNLPLSLSLSSSLDYDPRFYGQLHLVDTLLEFAPRARVLKLSTSDEVLGPIARLKCDWPFLERVVVDADAISEYDPSEDVLTFSDVTLWNAPNLKSVEWRSVDSVFYHVRKPSQWKQMEEILMSSPHPQFISHSGFQSGVLRTMLRGTPNLVKLRIAVSDEDDHETPGELLATHALFRPIGDLASPLELFGAPVILERLTTLELVDVWANTSEGEVITPFLQGLHLPALTSMTYTLRSCDSYGEGTKPLPVANMHPLVLFLRAQLQPINITHWTVDSSSICDEAFLTCLRLMPKLEELWVRAESKRDGPTYPFNLIPDDDPLQEFVRPRDRKRLNVSTLSSQILCPRLHSLRFDVSDFSMEGIHAFLEVRVALARLSQEFACSTSALKPNPESLIAVPRRFYSRGICDFGVYPRNLYHPIVNGRSLRCKDNPSRCTLIEDCERFGIKTVFDTSDTSYKREELRGGNRSAGILKPLGRARLAELHNPNFGLPQDGSDYWP